MSALLGLVSTMLGLLGERQLGWLTDLGGAFWYHGVRYRRRGIDENLRQAFPTLDPRAIHRLGRAACAHLLRSLADLFRIPAHLRRGIESVVRIDGLEHYRAAKAKGKGVLCLSGHLGSFELCMAAVAKVSAPSSVVVRDLPLLVDRFFTRIRQSAGFGLIPAGEVRTVMRALANNEVVVIILDQNSTRSMGVFVDFFGKPACTISGLASLADRTGAAVIPAIAHREADGHHVLTIHSEIPFERTGDRAQSIHRMTQVYTRFLEDQITLWPAQWFWTHKRWRTRPAPAITSTEA